MVGIWTAIKSAHLWQFPEDQGAEVTLVNEMSISFSLFSIFCTAMTWLNLYFPLAGFLC